MDILPAGTKTCTLDCVYCQLGPCARTTNRRRDYTPVAPILRQVREALASGRPIDFITFSGSGEPTLHKSLGRIVAGIKRLTGIPVAVLTNATLLGRPEVRRALRDADLVVPSFDAATAGLFRRVNRPHRGVRLESLTEGLRRFREEYAGTIWLEVMLVKGLNDSPAHLDRLAAAIAALRPDKVHLNTPVRPPAEPWARPLSPAEMEAVRRRLGDPRVEVAADFRPRGAEPSPPPGGPSEAAVLAVVRRRPVTLDDIAAGLGAHPNEVLKPLERLLAREAVRRVEHRGRTWYEAAGGGA